MRVCLPCLPPLTLVRVVFLSVDPLGVRRHLALKHSEILSTLSFAPAISANILIILYWYVPKLGFSHHNRMELTQKRKLAFGNFLGKYQWIFWLVAACLVGFDISIAIVRGVDLSETNEFYTFVIEVAVYCTTALCVGIFYIVSGIKIIRQLRGSKVNAKNKSTSRLLLKTTILIQVSAFCEL